MSDLPKVRIEIGERAVFTRVYIDDEELRGVTRVWFDSGNVDPHDGPRLGNREYTRVHVEFYPAELLVTGHTDVSAMETKPVRLRS